MAGSAMGGAAQQIATPAMSRFMDPSQTGGATNVVRQPGGMAPAPAAATGGKGGGSAAYPAPQRETVNQVTGVGAPAGGFNINQAAAGGLQAAMQGTAAGMNYQPMQVGAASYRPSTIAGTNLGAYTNPYETQVVNTALGDLERSRQMQQNQLGAQASSARAFGGSRQGIAEAETNRAFAQQAANTAAQLRQAGYGQAQGLAGQDVATRNAAAQYAASAQNAAMAANQTAGLQGLQQRLSAASQMGALGQQAFNTSQAITNQQLQQGTLQQALQQQLIDAARNQYAGFTNAPTASLNAPLAALGATPQTSTTTSSQQPGLFNYLSLPFML